MTSVSQWIKQPKYWQPVFQMVKNFYYHSPHFDLKFWKIDNTDAKNTIGGIERNFMSNSPVNLEEFWLEITALGPVLETMF